MAVIRRGKHGVSSSSSSSCGLIQCLMGAFCCVLTSLVILTIYSISLSVDNTSDNTNYINKNHNSIVSHQHPLIQGDVRNVLRGDRVSNVAEKRDELDNPDALSYSEDPMTMKEVMDFIDQFISELHQKFIGHKKDSYVEVWKIYHDFALEKLYPWDREYLQRMPKRRTDGTVFLSLASYRDENCLNTITWAYEKSKNPEKLNVGLVQQNCVENCIGGILDKYGHTEDVPPDDDCHKLFCDSEVGREHCAAGRVRALHINEDESLGPYAARYFASKLWGGEEWFMQVDAHMTFLQDWDAISIEMLQKAPTKKPVISHYPPDDQSNLENLKETGQTSRLCGADFASSDLEDQIIRLGLTSGGKSTDAPRFAPYIAAGYFVAHSSFLSEVPFDPFLPWIFMGEEIIMSARMWTSGYDIYSPRTSVVGHIYFRRKKPKFWESVHRLFHYGVHNPLQMLVLQRVKAQLNYPESEPDFIRPQSILTHVDKYSMGTERSLEDYLTMAGLDMVNKRQLQQPNRWCERGIPPPGMEEFASLYPPTY